MSSTLNRRSFALSTAAALALPAGTAFAQPKPLGGQTVRIMWIDPLTGLMAPVGSNQLKTAQFLADRFTESNPAGVRFEIVGFDNKLSPTESVNALNSAIDKGIRYVVQGDGSAVASALIDSINRHNERNPGKEVVYLNVAAADPDFTSSKCSFWHFRFDADTSMKMEAITTYIAGDKDIRKVFLFGQNYAHGQQISKFAKADLKRKRPDIEIVGDDLHPLAQVRDFSPYIAKIKASGADTVITGNWGSDLSLLFKAAFEGGFQGKFFTYNAVVTGTPAALGTQGADRVFQIGQAHYNMGGRVDDWMDGFKKKFDDDMYTLAFVRIFEFLGQAMAKTRSTDPVKVAFAMEGMKFTSAFGGEVQMRKADHQIQTVLYMVKWAKANAKYRYSPEKTGMTMIPVAEYPPYIASTPTSCQMVRPAAT